MIAQAVVNIDEGHTTIEPGSAVHDGMKDLIGNPVYEAAPDLLAALQALSDLARDRAGGKITLRELFHDVSTKDMEGGRITAAIAKATGQQ